MDEEQKLILRQVGQLLVELADAEAQHTDEEELRLTILRQAVHLLIAIANEEQLRRMLAAATPTAEQLEKLFPPTSE
jgi:hypothetical protein